MSTATWFMLGLTVLALLYKYWTWRSDQKEALEHADEVAAFASKVGGTVTDDPSPWSVDLEPPFRARSGVSSRLFTVASGPQFDLAVEFERHGWTVRVTEASIEVRTAGSDGTVQHQEYRIEVATADLVPMKVVTGPDADDSDWRRWAAKAPQTVAGQERPLWMELSPPESVDHAHIVFTSDLVEADSLLNAQAIAWLQDKTDRQVIRRLTFEAGLVYMVSSGQIEEQPVLRKVDAIIELLDRIPGARPQHQAA